MVKVLVGCDGCRAHGDGPQNGAVILAAWVIKLVELVGHVAEVSWSAPSTILGRSSSGGGGGGVTQL